MGRSILQCHGSIFLFSAPPTLCFSFSGRAPPPYADCDSCFSTTFSPSGPSTHIPYGLRCREESPVSSSLLSQVPSPTGCEAVGKAALHCALQHIAKVTRRGPGFVGERHVKAELLWATSREPHGREGLERGFSSSSEVLSLVTGVRLEPESLGLFRSLALVSVLHPFSFCREPLPGPCHASVSEACYLLCLGLHSFSFILHFSTLPQNTRTVSVGKTELASRASILLFWSGGYRIYPVPTLT